MKHIVLYSGDLFPSTQIPIVCNAGFFVDNFENDLVT